MKVLKVNGKQLILILIAWRSLSISTFWSCYKSQQQAKDHNAGVPTEKIPVAIPVPVPIAKLALKRKEPKS